ncbi:hypothetical protein KAH37_07615, partial [bacterium]|nr:hypothetical protein [bacterium]
MKKRLLLLFVLLLFIASCGEEETPPIVDGDNSVDIDSRGDDLSRPDIDDSADSAPDEDSGNTADSVTDADEADSGDSAEDGDSANTGDSTSDADACISGTIESQDCDTSGKQIRTCESGVWSDYSDCLDITTKIRDIASTSACADISWLDRGSAPSAYIQGVGLVFASAVCNNTRDDIVLASQAKTTDLEHDALAWYDDINIFANLGMSNDVAGMATLR